nr:IS5 family transposase [Jeongeupia sp. HS-3]
MADDRRHACQGASACRRRTRRQSGNGGDQRGLNSKLHLAVDAHGMPVRVLVTSGTTADCTQGGALIDGLSAEYLLADRGYDSDAIVAQASAQGMRTVIPSHRNRKAPREHDAALYRHRHLVENAFLQLKRWRGIATRYAKNAASFLAAVQIRCIAIWARIL